MWLKVFLQFMLEFLWCEIYRRDLVSPHHLEQIPEIQMEKFCGFPLGNGMPAQ
jgi:hypothetical protein